MLLSRAGERVNSFFEQCAEPGSGAVECADFAEQIFHRPVAGKVINVPNYFVAEASTSASEKIFKGRGEREIASDHLHCAALAREIISKDPRNVSPCDVGQRRVAGLKNLAARFIKRAMSPR